MVGNEPCPQGWMSNHFAMIWVSNEPCPRGSDYEITCKLETCISKGTPFSIPPHDLNDAERVVSP